MANADEPDDTPSTRDPGKCCYCGKDLSPEEIENSRYIDDHPDEFPIHMRDFTPHCNGCHITLMCK